MGYIVYMNKEESIIPAVFSRIDLEWELPIEEAIEMLSNAIETYPEGIKHTPIGDTSIITVNGRPFLDIKWDPRGYEVVVHEESFPILGLLGTVLILTKNLEEKYGSK